MDRDVLENHLQEIHKDLLPTLLADRSSGRNIIWASDGYSFHGEGYNSHDEITPEAISGENGNIIVPRLLKGKDAQTARSREKGEVFTPAWVINEQLNTIDAEWFRHNVVFNRVLPHGWKTRYEKINFSRSHKSWQDYILANRLEVSCGEAPYLTSRYDVVSGLEIPVRRRIGILDRKLRIVTENTTSAEEWLAWAEKALQSVYGYEWQGDNVLLARENVLCAVAEAYTFRFNEPLPVCKWLDFARIVSWNIWQMDGLKYVIPSSCQEIIQVDLIGRETRVPCPGCKESNFKRHSGVYCQIMDWQANTPVRFIDLFCLN